MGIFSGAGKAFIFLEGMIAKSEAVGVLNSELESKVEDDLVGRVCRFTIEVFKGVGVSSSESDSDSYSDDDSPVFELGFWIVGFP